MTTGKFHGDVSPRQAWQGLTEVPASVLVDVRTVSEWTFVGGPDLSSLNKPVLQIEWQYFPGMARNESFVDAFRNAGITVDQPVYLICRSGVRSKAAAIALAEHGYSTYNVADGFEGQLAPDGHRGAGGWRTDGLPWKQS